MVHKTTILLGGLHKNLTKQGKQSQTNFLTPARGGIKSFIGVILVTLSSNSG